MTGTATRDAPRVRPAAGRDLDPLIELITEVFSHSSLGHHLVPDVRARPITLRRYLRLIVAHAMTHGRVTVIGDAQAAAIWYRDGPLLRRIPAYPARLAQATAPHTSRFIDLDTARAEHHPTDRPHTHLGYLAVRPDLRHHGLADRLLDLAHQELDRAGGHAYVEALDPHEARLFARHGYTPMPAYRAGPAAAPLLTPMWRPPRG